MQKLKTHLLVFKFLRAINHKYVAECLGVWQVIISYIYAFAMPDAPNDIGQYTTRDLMIP